MWHACGPKTACRFSDGRNLKESAHMEDAGTDTKIILKWPFQKRNVKTWTVLI
jgi:hypothetical protein